MPTIASPSASTSSRGGFSLIPLLVGAFGFAEVLTAMKDKTAPPALRAFDSVLPRFGDVLRYWKTVLRSGVIGVYVGILPGVGEDMAAWSSYAAARRASKEREQFGKGSVEGLIAAETGDNASIPGAIIPALALAIPGSAPAAVLLAAMIIHGVRPGPLLMVEQPQFVYDVVAMCTMATLGILFFGLFLIRPMLLVLRIPRTIIMPIIFVLCVVGSYAIAQRLFDVWTMLGFGVAGYFCASSAITWRRSCSASCSATFSTRACAAAWCSPTAAWSRSSRGRSAWCCG